MLWEIRIVSNPSQAASCQCMSDHSEWLPLRWLPGSDGFTSVQIKHELRPEKRSVGANLGVKTFRKKAWRRVKNVAARVTTYALSIPRDQRMRALLLALLLLTTLPSVSCTWKWKITLYSSGKSCKEEIVANSREDAEEAAAELPAPADRNTGTMASPLRAEPHRARSLTKEDGTKLTKTSLVSFAVAEHISNRSTVSAKSPWPWLTEWLMSKNLQPQ